MKALDRFLQQARINQVMRYVKQGARLLDIGCADGALYQRVPYVHEYVGIDPEAPTELNASNVLFIRSSFPTPAISLDARFDVITALAILEHIPKENQSAFAAACSAHLDPGGLLLITVPAPVVDSILVVLKGLRLVDGMHEEQHYGYRPEDTLDLFEAHGLVLDRHVSFELGLNHLFVFRKPAD